MPFQSQQSSCNNGECSDFVPRGFEPSTTEIAAIRIEIRLAEILKYHNEFRMSESFRQT